VVFAEQTSEDPADWFQWFNSVWCMARPQLLFLARQGELSVFNLTKNPARRNEQPGSRLLNVVSLTADVQEKLHQFRRDQVESGRLFEDNRFGFEDRADRALVRDLERVRAALLQEGLAPEYAHALIGRSIFIRYLEDRKVLTKQYFRRIAKTDTSEKWDALLDEVTVSDNGLGHPIFYPHILNDKDFTYALFTQLANDFNGDMFPVNAEERKAVSQKHLKLLHRFLLGGKDEKLFFFAYRFDIIPIELISSIYEMFYSLDRKKKKNEGSYYTPAALVEFVLSQTLSEDILAEVPRVLDPACGSGIFLVEAFRRIVRYRVATMHRPPTRDELCTVLWEQIAGADINPEAIRVAAFSLYLAMLHYLDPPNILRNKLPCLTYSARPGKKPHKDYDILVAENVFRIEETIPEPTVRNRFASGCTDVVIGNPPWGSSKDEEGEDPGGEEWCAKRGLSVGYRERSETFIHRTMDLLKPGGRAGLLVSTGVFFKRHKNTREFRAQWLSQATLGQVVNFAAVRKAFFRNTSEERADRTNRAARETERTGGIAPFVSVVFDKAPPTEESRFSYWSAKETAFVRNVQAVILNRADLRMASQPEFMADDTLWKVYWWGGHRDAALIERLKRMPTLRDVIDPHSEMGQGFQRVKNGKTCDWLQKYPECPIKVFVRYGKLPLASFRLPPKRVHRSRREELYKGARLLVKRGVGNDERGIGRIVARYEEADFSFRHSIFSIPLANKTTKHAKVALGVMWSSLVRYFLFMTSGEWGMWHDAIQSVMIHSIPMPLPKTPALKARIVRIVDALRAMHDPVPNGSIFVEEGSISQSEWEVQVRRLESQLDEAVYELFELTPEERERIEEVCSMGLDLYYKGMKSAAVEPLDWDTRLPQLGRIEDLAGKDSELAQYLTTFLELWNPHLADQNGHFRWRIIRPLGGSSMTAAIFHSEPDAERLPAPTNSDEQAWESLLQRLEESSRQHAGPQRVYIDGLVRIVSDEDIVIIKRNERRLWTRSAARDDAEATIVRALHMNGAAELVGAAEIAGVVHV
jgi:predicted RNA methylase